MNNQSKSLSSNSNTAQAQKQRLKNQLQEHGSFTTVYARDVLDVPSPAPRVFELRHDEGLNIQSVWTTDKTVQGVKHKFVRYVLKSGTYGVNANVK